MFGHGTTASVQREEGVAGGSGTLLPRRQCSDSNSPSVIGSHTYIARWDPNASPGFSLQDHPIYRRDVQIWEGLTCSRAATSGAARRAVRRWNYRASNSRPDPNLQPPRHDAGLLRRG